MDSKKYYELTNPQKNIWNVEQYYSGTAINNICGSVIIKEKADLQILENAINKFIENNDSFKTRIKIIDGIPHQYFIDNKNYSFKKINLKDKHELNKYAKELVNKPFSIIDSQLFNFILFTMPNHFSGFIVIAHHIISDAATFSIIGSEIMSNYLKLKNGDSIPSKEYSYINYIEAEKKYLSSERYKKDQAYWNELNFDEIYPVTIPSSKKEKDSVKANRLEFSFDKNLIQKINHFCKSNNISIYNFLISLYSIYLGRINATQNFAIGTPILNRSKYAEKHTSGMFISTSLLNISTQNNPTFTNFIHNVTNQCMSMLKHQKYDYTYILQDARQKNSSIGNLYDIILSYQATKATDSTLPIEYESNWHNTPYINNSLDIHFHDNNNEGSLLVDYDYKTCKYVEQDITSMHNRIMHIIKQVLENPEIQIDDIDIITPQEKDIILNRFNNTQNKFDTSKSILQIFEEQVKKSPNSIAVVFENTRLTYEDLNKKANSLARHLEKIGINPHMIISIYLDKSIETIIAILAILKLNCTYMPIDIDYPISRIRHMLKISDSKNILTTSKLKNNLIDYLTNITFVELDDQEIYKNSDINLKIQAGPNDSAYVMFTSGSTGNPKGVEVTNKNIVRLVKNPNYITFNKHEKILQTGSIVFDACTFEIWSALLNGFELYIIKKQDLLDPQALEKYLVENKITILWITAPLFNQLSEHNPGMFKTARVLLTGGDVLSPKHINSVKKACPNLTIINGYGPTENTTFSTCFTIDKKYETSIPIGYPIANSTCYIVSKNLQLMPVGVPGELLVGGDGVSKGYLNNPEGTTEKFIPNIFGTGKLYKTGDLAKWNEDGSISFLGRIDNQLKIRGYRIELDEINISIKKHPKINEVITVVRTDGTEKTLCSYFSASTNIDTIELRKFLLKILPNYSIPQFFVQLDSLPLNANGKIDMNKLPLPKETSIKKNTDSMPKTEMQKQLANIWSQILHIKEIGIYDNFFEIGGDSLSAIKLCVQLQDKLKIQIHVKDILEHSTIKELSDYIENTSKITNNTEIKKVPLSDTYAVSSAQKRIYYATQASYSNSVLYNTPGGILINGILDTNKLQSAFTSLIKRHESFRTVFELNDDILVQRIINNINFKLEITENVEYNELDTIFKKFVQPFDLAQAPLIRAKYLIFTNKTSALLVDMHHIISDGTSLKIFIDELCKLYNGDELPELKITYKDFSAHEQYNLTYGKMNEAEEYWLNQFKGELPILNMPTKSSRPLARSNNGNKVYSSIDTNTFEKIQEICKSLKITPYMMLLTCYYILLSVYTSQKDIIIGSPIIGRDIPETQNLIGMFVNTLALRNTVDNNLTFKEFVNIVKQNVLEAYKHQTYPFDELIKNLNLKKDSSRNPLFDTMFIYQNDIFKELTIGENSCSFYMPHTNSSKFDISLEAIPSKNNISLSFEYTTDLFEEDFIIAFSNHYLNIIKNVLNNIDCKISNIDIMSNEEKLSIINGFNNTYVRYDKNNTIMSAFEEQVVETPDSTALVCKDSSLTYKELYEKVNSLAMYLRKEAKIKRNEFVGIMVNRSLEMIVSILAVLKAGGAYIPIDPTYPQKRITYMLENSDAKVLLTQKHLQQKLETSTNIICVDLDNEEIYSKKYNRVSNVNSFEDIAYAIFTSGSTGKPKGVMLKHKALINLMNYCNNYIEYLKDNSRKTIVSITTISFDIFIFETLISLQKGLKVVIADENEQTTPHLLNDLLTKHNVEIIQSTPSRMQILFNNLNTIPALKKLKYVVLAGEQLPLSLVKDLSKALNVTVYNGYGPSETTVFSTLTKMNTEKITIGKPLYNTQIYILDHKLKPVPIGVPGEIYISGDGVGKGYIHNDELNKKSFIPNPFIPKTIMYKTGDTGCYNTDGTITCLGRLDNQVKIHGLRIELEEIETRIKSIASIDACIVVKKKNLQGQEFLCAYYTSNREISNEEIRANLEKNLPNYMIPTYYIKLEKLPYTPSGKIDKKNLPEPDYVVTSKKDVKSRNNIDIELIEIMKHLFKIENISINTSFFDLGGDSLSAVNLCVHVRENLNVKLNVKDILEHPILKDLSDLIGNKDKVTKKIEITPIEKSDKYQISSAQKRIYFSSKMAGQNNILYNLPDCIILEKAINAQKLETSFNKIIERHEAFRTYFEIDGEDVVQKILDKASIKLNIQENADYNDLDKIFISFIKPFDLSKAPLIRAKYITFTNGKSAIIVDMHHIISDGASFKVFVDDLSKAYNEKELSKVELTYKDYSAFENKGLVSGNFEKSKKYWLEQFKDNIPVLNMPTTYPRPVNATHEGKRIYTTIDKNTIDKMNQLSKKLKITPYMILLSCYYILLSKYTSQEDIVIGSPYANRNIAKVESIIGMFVNTLALRNKVDNNLTFEEFVVNIKNMVLEAYKYHHYPFDELVSNLHIPRDTSRSPLFDTMFTYQSDSYEPVNFESIQSDFYLPDMHISKFDLSVEAIPLGNKIALSFEYATKLFSEEFISNLSTHYINILDIVLENCTIQLSNIDMISSTEKNKILFDFNNTEIEYPKDKSIIDLFENQVEKSPNNIAVIFDNTHLTYEELNKKANSVARHIEKLGIKPNTVVSIYLDKSIETIIAILAILKLNCTYMPIDIEYPISRIRHMLKISNSNNILTTSSLKNNLVDYLTAVTFVELDNPETYQNLDKNLNIQASPNDSAYVMFTSGSTGNPKGVEVTNKNIIRLVKNPNYITFNKHEKILQTGSIVFDACTFEIWSALLNGFELYIIKKQDLLNPQALEKYLIENKITILWITAPLFNKLSEHNPGMFKTARVLLTGGDVLSPKHINSVKKACPNLTIINGYGPTENTTFSTCFTIDKEYETSIPIGYPIANSTCYIVSQKNLLMPVGVPGELLVGGDGVSKGYINNPEGTAEKFIQNIFGTGKLYKTGDLAKWNEDGSISFLGRIDNQLKIRGYRIELDEINISIKKHPEINEVITVVRTDGTEKTLCSYFSASTNIDTAELRKFLLKILPNYSIPQYFVQLDSLPLNANGKVDMNQLPQPKETSTKSNFDSMPKTEIQKQLAYIWSKILHIKDIGIHDNFFEIGGDSLSAMNLNLELLKLTDKISYADLFRYPTIAEIEAKILQDDNTPLFKKIENLPAEYLDVLDNSLNRQKIAKYHPKGVILTGATGFLGIHILESIIKNETSNIYCIIRPKDGCNTEDRLTQKLHFYFGTKYDNLINKRIFVIPGDTSKPNFGIKNEDVNKIANSVDLVINSAAIVAHYGNYNKFFKTNVQSVKYIVDFCKTYNKKLYHISTRSVAGRDLDYSYLMNNKKYKVKFNESSLYIGQLLDGVYSRSKFEAESVILSAINSGLDAYILRMGNLMPRSSDGVFQENASENSFLNKFASYIKLGFIPNYLLNYKFEFTPVDCAARAITTLIEHPSISNRIFHLYNQKNISVRKVLKLLKKFGYNIVVLSEQDFKNKINKILDDDDSKNLLKYLIDDFDSDLHLTYKTNILMNSNFTIRYLRRTNFRWPRITNNYLSKIIKIVEELI